jgi:type VI secretion system secreted protein VgrG
MTDWNFKRPDAVMEMERMSPATYAESQLEAYDFPGDYQDAATGKIMAKLRLDEEKGGDQRHRAVGDCTSLSAGMTLTLTGDQVPGVKGDRYLCLSASHSYVSES